MRDDIEETRIFNPGDPFRHFHYVVERFLGAGFSGQVYAVRHRFTGDRFALKVSHLADHNNAKKAARSLIEAQASYRIRHANVVEVVDLGCEDDGMVWQLMELLDGQAVAALLRRYGRISPIHAIDIAIETAWGLQAAHEIGLVHRDVQPSNVFVTSDGRVKVLDFSLSSWVHSPLKTTHGRRPRGTLGYMAPEHVRGAAPTPWFDVYALGIMLWQMMAGRHPFEESLGNAMRIVERQLNGEPASLVGAAGLPAYCDDVVRGAIAKDPRARYAGMWPFAQALTELRERLLSDESARVHVRHMVEWERLLPIVRGTESALRHGSSRSPLAPAAAPPLPSARVYVAQPVATAEASGAPAPPAARPKVAATVPMEAVPMEAEPQGAVVAAAAPGGLQVNRTPMAVAAPQTVRRPRPSPVAWWIGVGLSVPVLLGLGAFVWVLGGATVAGPGAVPVPAPPPSSTVSAAPPRSSAPAASAPSSERPRLGVPAPVPRRGSLSSPGH